MRYNDGTRAAPRIRISKFYFTLAVIVLVFFVVLQIGLAVLRGWLKDYESSQPKYVAEQVYKDYFESIDLEKLVSMQGVNVTPFETTQNVLDYLKTLTGNEVTSYFSTSTGVDSDSVKYVVKLGEKKLSTFTLVKSGKKSAHGFDLYELDPSSIELSYYAKNGVNITVPQGSKLYINDIEVPADYITGDPIKYNDWKGLPDGLEGPYMVQYKVDGLYSKPTVRVVSADGRENTVNYDEENKVYTTDLLYDDDTMASKYDAYIIEAMEKYSAYMQYDGSFAACAKYFDPNSDLYESIRSSLTMFVLEHSSYSFEDVNVRDYYVYNDSTFSVRISYTHLLHRTGSEDYKDFIDMTLYLRNVGGTYKIYYRTNNN